MQKDLTFELTSNLLGKNEQKLSFQVVPARATEKYHIDVDSAQIENIGTTKDLIVQTYDKLDIKQIDISSLGKMKLIFNKTILSPQIKTIDKEFSSDQRFLSINLFDIKEVIALKVRDAGEDEDLDKSIYDVSLVQFYKETLDLSVKFN